MKIYDKIETTEHSCSCVVTWKRICIGKDIMVSFPVTIDGEEASLADKDIQLELINPIGAKIHLDFSVSGNIIAFTYLGMQQKISGIYSVKLWLNKGKVGQSVLDFPNVFELVRTTAEENINTTLSGESEEIEEVPITLGTVNLNVGAKSAYQYAVEHGYIGTEEEFGQTLADLGNVGSEIADDLTTDSGNIALSARQGKLLNEKIEDMRYIYELNNN